MRGEYSVISQHCAEIYLVQRDQHFRIPFRLQLLEYRCIELIVAAAFIVIYRYSADLHNYHAVVVRTHSVRRYAERLSSIGAVYLSGDVVISK